MANPTHPTVMPALRYRDVPAAIKWLERAFGLRTRMSVPGPGNTIAHAELTSGDAGMIMLGSLGKPDPKNAWSDKTHGIYVVVDDIDAHYARAKAAGATILMELHDTPYGSREYSARDPDGHPWSFGTYQPFGEKK